MKNNKFVCHTLFKNKKYALQWSFDTFRTPDGNDRALCNGIRLIGLFGTWYVLLNPKYILFPLLILFMVAVGITRVDYFKHKRKKFEFKAWC